MVRVATLRALGLLEPGHEEDFAAVTRLAAHALDAPISVVSFIDEAQQCYRGGYGLPDGTTPRDVSFCGHTIAADDLLVVPDTCSDLRFHDNPVVTGGPQVRFYAGVPIRAHGQALGALCVADVRPRELSARDELVLRDLARLVERIVTTSNLAITDELTRLYNRRGLLRLGVSSLSLARRRGEPVALLYADLDGLKRLNDTLGHAAGDRAIAGLAEVLVTSCRRSDVVARLGGDEFACLLVGCTTEAAAIVERRVVEAAAAFSAREPSLPPLGVSLGTFAVELPAVGAAPPDDEAVLDELLARADRLMYERKRARALESARAFAELARSSG